MKSIDTAAQAVAPCHATAHRAAISRPSVSRSFTRKTQHAALPSYRTRNTATIRHSAILVHASYGSQWSTPPDAYLTLGLAHCFEKNDDGKLRDCYVIEPISANALECMANGARTCFKHVFSMTLEDALTRNKAALPAELQDGAYCDNFAARCDACARTWMRPHAMDNLLYVSCTDCIALHCYLPDTHTLPFAGALFPWAK